MNESAVHPCRQPKAEMPLRFLRRAPLNHRLQKSLEKARNSADGIRPLAEQAAWSNYEAHGTRYGAQPTVSQQKSRRVARRIKPHGWKGGAT